jgi:hypothetical protein
MIFTAVGFPPGGSFRRHVPEGSNIIVNNNVVLKSKLYQEASSGSEMWGYGMYRAC